MHIRELDETSQDRLRQELKRMYPDIDNPNALKGIGKLIYICAGRGCLSFLIGAIIGTSLITWMLNTIGWVALFTAGIVIITVSRQKKETKQFLKNDITFIYGKCARKWKNSDDDGIQYLISVDKHKRIIDKADWDNIQEGDTVIIVNLALHANTAINNTKFKLNLPF